MSQQILDGLNGDNITERAANLKRMLSNGSFSSQETGELAAGHVHCPICNLAVPSDSVNTHVDDCLLRQFLRDEQRNGSKANSVGGGSRTPPMSPPRRGKRKRTNSTVQITPQSPLLVPDNALDEPESIRRKVIDVPQDDVPRDSRFAISKLMTSMPSDRECVICLDPFVQGNAVATLHCLCMFHHSMISANHFVVLKLFSPLQSSQTASLNGSVASPPAQTTLTSICVDHWIDP